MHISRIGKQIDHLVEYVVKKLKRLPAWAQNLFEDSPRGLHLVIVAVGAAKFRIRRERGGRMARQLDLGDRGNVSLPGILHDIFYLFLGIKTLDRDAVPDIRREVAALNGFRAFRADSGQSRIFFDLDPPALVIGEMPLEIVEFIPRQQIDIFFDKRHGHKMPRGIEEHSAIVKTRFVRDLGGGKGGFIFERVR